MVLEKGKPAECRDRDLPADIGGGVGGAGIFSDGKFSFYPSATHLWELLPIASLSAAYAWASVQLGGAGLNVPPFPWHRPNSLAWAETGYFQTKEYPSLRLALDKRLQLVQSLSGVDVNLQTSVEVTGLQLERDGVVVRTRRGIGESHIEQEVLARAAIVATGRLGAITLLPWLRSVGAFRRLEIGIRIEQAEEDFFLRDADGLDPKLIGQNQNGVEWRTFCCCREGQVIEVLSNGVLAVAGRSDLDSSKKSNVAFLVRITDPEFGARVLPDVMSHLERQPSSFSIRVDHIEGDAGLIGVLIDRFGTDVASELALGLRKLSQQFKIRGPVTIHGPSVEGVGFYPEFGRDLRVAGWPLWLAGDVAGTFRGLTAAFVSGYFAGRECAGHICA